MYIAYSTNVMMTNQFKVVKRILYEDKFLHLELQYLP